MASPHVVCIQVVEKTVQHDCKNAVLVPLVNKLKEESFRIFTTESGLDLFINLIFLKLQVDGMHRLATIVNIALMVYFLTDLLVNCGRRWFRSLILKVVN